MGEEKDKRSATEIINNNLFGDLVYTVVFDVCNEVIRQNPEIGDKNFLECGNAVIEKYVESGIRVRKKPAPRQSKPRATVAREKATDMYTAASRKAASRRNVSSYNWVQHPDNENYVYTKDVSLKNGYPLIEVGIKKVVGVINEEGTKGLTSDDAKIAASYGLEINHKSIIT